MPPLANIFANTTKLDDMLESWLAHLRQEASVDAQEIQDTFVRLAESINFASHPGCTAVPLGLACTPVKFHVLASRHTFHEHLQTDGARKIKQGGQPQTSHVQGWSPSPPALIVLDVCNYAPCSSKSVLPLTRQHTAKALLSAFVLKRLICCQLFMIPSHGVDYIRG